jgi:hypothetical protein
MRIESSVTSVSWIPSEAVRGMLKVPFEIGLSHYDDPLPDRLDDLEAWRDSDRFRFANELRAYLEVDEDGRITDAGYLGHGWIGSTTLQLGNRELAISAVAFSDLRSEPEVGDGWVRFQQTAGGRTGVPAPRRINRPPFFRIVAPTAWTTLVLTIHADGRVEFEVAGASPFPRHWIYGPDGMLAAKSGLIDFKEWSQDSFGTHTPWGDVDSPALVTAVETALERELSTQIMRAGEKPRIRELTEGEVLTHQGESGAELFLVLDGVLEVAHDGSHLTDIGPGSIVGERAILEGGRRTSTLTARTPVKVAVATPEQVDRDALVALSRDHRREEQAAT